MAEYSGFAGTLKLGNGDGPPETFTAIAQIRDISGPSEALTAVDVSSRDNRQMKFKAGMVDSGEVTFDLVFDAALTAHSGGTGGLRKFLRDGTEKNYQIGWADAAKTDTFAALVTGFEPQMPMNDAQTASVTLKITGAITST